MLTTDFWPKLLLTTDYSIVEFNEKGRKRYREVENYGLLTKRLVKLTLKPTFPIFGTKDALNSNIVIFSSLASHARYL